MAGAAYELNLRMTDDESFVFSCQWKLADGTDFPWADYTYEYRLSECGSAIFDLTGGSGITLTEALHFITFAKAADYRIPAGTYEHACRITHIETEGAFVMFDGTVTVSKEVF